MRKYLLIFFVFFVGILSAQNPYIEIRPYSFMKWVRIKDSLRVQGKIYNSPSVYAGTDTSRYKIVLFDTQTGEFMKRGSVGSSGGAFWQKGDDSTQYSVYKRVSIGAHAYTGGSILGVTGNEYITGLINFNNRGSISGIATGGLAFKGVSGQPQTWYDVSVLLMRLMSNGRLGIGDSVPKYLLDVKGQARLGLIKYPTTLPPNGYIAYFNSPDSTLSFRNDTMSHARLLNILGGGSYHLSKAKADTLEKNDGASIKILQTQNGVVSWGVPTSGGSIDTVTHRFGWITIERYHKPTHYMNGIYIDSLANTTAYPDADSCHVVFSAGYYHPTANIARQTMSWHFEGGSYIYKSTAGYLFDFNALGNDRIKPCTITGDGVFNCAYGIVYFYQQNYSFGFTFSCSKKWQSRSTNATAITGLTSSYISGNIKSSGGSCVKCTGYQADKTVLDGTFQNTTSDKTIDILPNQYVNMDIRGELINSSTGYCVGSTFGQVNINANISATNAVYLSTDAYFNFNGNLSGNIYINTASSDHLLATFNGTFINGTLTLDGQVNFLRSTVSIHGSYSNYNFVVGDDQRLAVTGDLIYPANGITVATTGVLDFTGNVYVYDGYSISQTAGTINWRGSIGARANYCWNYALSGGIANFYADVTANSTTASPLTITSTGRANIYGKWTEKYPISLSGGKLKIVSTGQINNVTNAADSTGAGIIVNASSTFLHDGGIITVTNSSANSIYNRAGKTLTIRNYNNYFTNHTRGGTGTYTETITGSGTEIVDPDTE